MTPLAWLERVLLAVMTGMGGFLGLAQARPEPGAAPDSPTTYHVAPDGDDRNPGTSADRPWASLQQAADRVRAGDEVLVAPGTYAMGQQLRILAQGTAERPIVFRSAGPGRPLLDFSPQQIDGPDRRDHSVLFGPGSAHLVFDGFEVAHAPGSGIRVDSGHHITIRHCLVRDVHRVAISIGGDDCLVEYNEVYNACLMAVGSNEWPGEWPQAVNSSRKTAVPPQTVGSMSHNVIFRGNYIHDSWGEGIDAIYSDGVIIEDNVIHDVMSVGVYLDHSRNVVIRGNSIYTTNDVRGRGPERRPMTGILLGAEYLSLFMDHPPHSHIQNIEIYNNVCVRVGRGIAHWLDQANTDNKNIYENVRIYHNTVDTKDGAWAPIWFVADLRYPTQGNECRNNILRGTPELSAAPGFVFSDNLWVNGVPPMGEHQDSWSGDPGWEQPQATPGMEGYRLRPNSPAIGRGVPVEGLQTDKGGRPRSFPPDLGAWEAGGRPPGNPPQHYAASLQMLERFPVPDFITGVNTVVNPGFEEPAPSAGQPPRGWRLEGDQDAWRIVSPGWRGVRPGANTPEGQAVEFGRESPYRVTLIQTLEGLPAGRYGLQLRVRRFGDQGTFWAETETATGERLRTPIPPRDQLIHFLVDYEDPVRYSKRWLQLQQSDIMITDGRITITVHGEGGADDRLLIDDVVFFRY
jgi:parallel beta-helix repeat protein